MSFGSTPSPPSPPLPPPKVPEAPQAPVRPAGSTRDGGKRRRAVRAQTLLTSGQGVLEKATVGKKTLLGGR